MSETRTDARDQHAELRARLLGAVRAVCPAWLRADADDIVQEAMLKVMAVLDRREGNEPLRASYLQRVAYTATIDEIRRRRSRPRPLEEDAMEHVSSTRPDPESITRGRQIGMAIEACLTHMLEARRRAVTMHLVGYSVREVAELLREKPKRADNLVYRGLADLRRCLARKGVQ
jgi:RNA polymerase sigma-70 factor, ECF subfamily